MNPYASLCDDFGAYVYVNTKMDLPSAREPVLHFFSSLKKAFPALTDFEQREAGEFTLEEDREHGSYRWVTLEARRLAAGYLNPPTLEAAELLHEHVLEIAPYHLDLSGMDCEALDTMYAFDFVYQGNHDEVVAEALGTTTSLDKIITLPHCKIIGFEPTLLFTLDDACRLQCRLSIETRTTAYHVRTGSFPEAPITVYFTVRQYWSRSPYKTFLESYRNQRRHLQELVESSIIPGVMRPLAQTIATRQ
jgi:hypothetical protein